LLALCLPLATAACAGGSRTPIEVRERFEHAPLPPVDVRLLLQAEHQRDAVRYMGAAMSTLRVCGEWLGPLSHGSVTLVDPAWHAPVADNADTVRLERAPWWSAATSLAPELATARPLSRRFLTEAIDMRRLPPWFVDGLVEYVARRAVMPIFEGANQPPGYAFHEERYFDRFVPRFVRIRLMAETDGTPVSAYRAHPRVGASSRARSADDSQRLAGKTVLALGTLDRRLGRPVFDAVVAEFAAAFRGRPPTLDDFERTASRVSGQDLSWFFDATFRSSDVYDYGVERLASQPHPGGVFETTVVARRYGDAQFTGSSTLPVGGYESGRGVALLVTFADGHRQIDYWDGRSREKVFRYRSAARALSAIVDPDRILLLDLQQTNNSKTLAPSAGPAATRWAGRFMLWLENSLLTYASLV
jgi:hypothetical protein